MADYVPEYVKVAKVGEVLAGAGKVVEAKGQEVALFNVDGAFHAIDNACKHRGGPLGEGELDGTVVSCPLHAWTYDVTNGECFDDPDCRVKAFPTRVEGDDVLIEI